MNGSISVTKDGLKKGSGLGLSIVHQLVEKMDGNITVEKFCRGKGTEFMLLFPLES